MKLAGRFLKVQIDDSAGTPRDVSADIDTVDIPDEFIELVMTGFGEQSENSIPGLLKFPIEMKGMFNPAATTGLFTVIKGIKGSYASKTVTIDIGQNATPTTGDPRIQGEFWCPKAPINSTVAGKITLNPSFRVFGSVAPTYGTVP